MTAFQLFNGHLITSTRQPLDCLSEQYARYESLEELFENTQTIHVSYTHSSHFLKTLSKDALRTRIFASSGDLIGSSG